MGQLFAVSVAEPLDQDLFQLVLSHVSLQKQHQIKRYYHREDAKRSLVAKLLVRTIACSSLLLQNAELEFQTNEWGKPQLAGREHFHFNISHAKDWVVCAVDTVPVGVDVEYIHSVDLAIAKQFFSPSEAEDLVKKPKEEQLGYFFDLWTLKESYIKAQGKGLSIPLDSFTFQMDQQGEIHLRADHHYEHCYFRQYQLHPEYKLSLCKQKDEFPDKVRVLHLQELLKQFFDYL